ncbi:zinc finger protein 182-like [Anopheles ziemanni]|nr:zinc finger protein 182-like [Anopheles ziemanni]
MFVHLTAFETEDNNAFPSVICLECKICLVQAFNIRQEFLAKAEFLVQLVAENKLTEYYQSAITKAQTSIKPIAPTRFIFADTDETCGYPSTKPLVPIHSPTSNNFITKSIKLKAPKQFIFTDINQAYRNLSANQLVSNDNATLQCSAGTLNENNAETNKNDVEQHEADKSDLNDHSCYTKVGDGIENSVEKNDDEQQNCLVESKAEKEDACNRSSTLEISSDENREQREAWHKFMVEYEKEKSMKRKLKAEQRRALKAQQGRKVIKKTNRLEEEARRMFPFTTCYVCDKQHDSMMECNFHMREHIPMLPYECYECMVENNKAEATEADEKYQPLELKTLNKLNLHFRMHRLPHKCDKCYRRFSTTTKLNAHVSNVHAFVDTGFTCEYCGKQYFDRTTFRTHVANHRNELSGQYKCLICDRTFGAKSSLKRHEVSHKGEKQYKCIYCDNSYSRSDSLLIHHRSHTGDRPHKCLECDRAFPQRNALLKHVCTPGHVKPPKYRSRLKFALLPSKDGHCPYPGCDYTASTYGAMYVHRRAKHRPVYQCEVCKKSFAFANQLNEHSRLHTGEKPYQCNICDRSFRTSQIHRNHLKTHTTDSNFSCEICQKSFRLPASLRQHMLTHSSERKFSCESCGNSYKTKGELTKHIQRKHSDENNEIKNEDENLQ